MKKLQISVLSLLLVGGLFTNTATAQEDGGTDGGLYIDINFGYNFSLNSQTLGVESEQNYDNNGNAITQTVINGSFGKGMKTGVNVGYMFNGNIGAELGINYLLGGTHSIENIASSFGGSTTRTADLSSSMLQINPSFVITTEAEGITPYAKFGIVIGLMGKINIEQEATGTGITDPYVMKDELSGGIALGMSAALGAKYSFNEKLSLFAELNMVNMSYAPTKGETTEYTENGIDYLVGATTREKETEFVSEIKSSTASDSNKPSESLKQNYSFSSLGIQVGLHIAF